MRAVSRAWKRTVQGSYTPQARATLVSYFQTGYAPVGPRIDILDGGVTIDGAADVRASLDITIPGSYWPTWEDSRLAPYGNELFVETGIRYSEDLVEWLGLGYFRIKTNAQDEPSTGGPLRLAGQDRMAGIIRGKPLAPIVFAATDTVSTMATTLLQRVYPLATVTFDDGTATSSQPLGRQIIVEDDAYGPLKALAEAYGKAVYFGPDGNLRFATVPTLTDRAVATLGSRGTLVELPRQLSDEGVVNAYVVRGDGMGATVAYGAAVNLDPASPTAYNGRFGPSPAFVTNSFITTDDQAKQAALVLLSQASGIPYDMSFTISPRPELEPFDPVMIEVREQAIYERHSIASLRIPLVAGVAMTGATRQQTITVGSLL